jgi:hypothetical protein
MSPSKVFNSMEEYNAFFKYVYSKRQKEKLLKEADQAIAWGHRDNESTGYSAAQFISVITQLKNYIEQMVP